MEEQKQDVGTENMIVEQEAKKNIRKGKIKKKEDEGINNNNNRKKRELKKMMQSKVRLCNNLFDVRNYDKTKVHE